MTFAKALKGFEPVGILVVCLLVLAALTTSYTSMGPEGVWETVEQFPALDGNGHKWSRLEIRKVKEGVYSAQRFGPSGERHKQAFHLTECDETWFMFYDSDGISHCTLANPNSSFMTINSALESKKSMARRVMRRV